MDGWQHRRDADNTSAARSGEYRFSGRCHDGFIGAFNGYSAFVMQASTDSVTIASVVNALNEDDPGQYAFIPGLIDSYIAAAEAPEPSPVPLPGGAALLGLGLAALHRVRRAQRGR